MSILEKLPAKEELKSNGKVVKVNGHFHTPFSFSAFENIEQVFEMADQEDIKVLGINDFITMDGYPAFHDLSVKHKKFPLFNIEFMGLLLQEQKEGIKVNDPNNPGRTYFSGKGLRFPVHLDPPFQQKLDSVFAESMKQTKSMVEKLNQHLVAIGMEDLQIPFEEIKTRYAKELVRERHIAKAVRTAVYEKYSSNEERKVALEKIYGKPMKADLNDVAAVDNEARGNLLKSGGVAFVAEDPKAFLEIPEVIEIIINAGGIPCYPTLLDNDKGEFTEFEENYENLYQRLQELNVHCIELIPTRNKFAIMKDFVKFFEERDIVVTFGTEHNTPAMEPLTVSCSDQPLDDYLLKIGYEGACVVAAHQYLHAKGEAGYVDAQGKAAKHKKEEFIDLGKKVIAEMTQ